MSHQVAAVATRAGTEIDHIVCPANSFFIVLNHQHGIAEVAEFFKRLQQTAVVAMVQSDGRLIQHVEDSAQLRSDLRSQADALAFAAGKCTGRTLSEM